MDRTNAKMPKYLQPHCTTRTRQIATKTLAIGPGSITPHANIHIPMNRAAPLCLVLALTLNAPLATNALWDAGRLGRQAELERVRGILSSTQARLHSPVQLAILPRGKVAGNGL